MTNMKCDVCGVTSEERPLEDWQRWDDGELHNLVPFQYNDLCHTCFAAIRREVDRMIANDKEQMVIFIQKMK